MKAADGRDCGRSDDLCLSDLVAVHGEQLDIAVPLAGLQFVPVHDEYVVMAGGYYIQELLADKSIRCAEAALEEYRSVDVVILGAGEDARVCNQSLRGVAVLP